MSAPTAKDLSSEPLEPVAWRWKFVDESSWTIVRHEPSCANDADVICQPLYALPSPQRDTP